MGHGGARDDRSLGRRPVATVTRSSTILARRGRSSLEGGFNLVGLPVAPAPIAVDPYVSPRIVAVRGLERNFVSRVSTHARPRASFRRGRPDCLNPSRAPKLISRNSARY